MSIFLQNVYASATNNEVELITLTLENSAFVGLSIADAAGAIRLARSYDDVIAYLEDGVTLVTYYASGIAVQRPSKNVSGKQELQFQIDNVSGEVLTAIEAARESGTPTTVTLRIYLFSDLSAPAETPVVMRATGAKVTPKSAVIGATFGDMVNQAWPRYLYTPYRFPGLRYW